MKKNLSHLFIILCLLYYQTTTRVVAWYLLIYTSFIYIPIVTPNIERQTVTSWHGTHFSAVLLNLPLQLLWHPHPPQVKYLIVENILSIHVKVFCCCFFSYCKGTCLDYWKEFSKAVYFYFQATYCVSVFQPLLS